MPPAPSGVPVAAPSPSSLAGRRVLVVDDDPAMLTLVEQLLGELQMQVSTARSHDQALQIARDPAATFDLLLIDSMLGADENGLRLAEALRPRWPDVPVVHMSGWLTPGTCRRQGLTVGIDFIPKPFNLARLRACLEQRLQGGAG